MLVVIEVILMAAAVLVREKCRAEALAGKMRREDGRACSFHDAIHSELKASITCTVEQQQEALIFAHVALTG